MAPEITSVRATEFSYHLEDVDTGPTGSDLVYLPGTTIERTVYAVQVRTSAGISGEYVGGTAPAFEQIDRVAEYLVGKDPLRRERHWNALKRRLRRYDRVGIGPIDVALWDFAGKWAGAPIHELLGSHRDRLPAYASTYFASERGGFDTPESFADFAEQCLELGYPGFKLHTWRGETGVDLEREREAVAAVGRRVGDEMDLMHDPVCRYETFADALAVGEVCDEHEYVWYEDPYMDTGRSQHAHRKLRERLETPLLLTELVRGVEPRADWIASEATDFVRADPDWDGGITGAMKIARIAEGFGLDVEFHLAGPAQRHCMAATRNSNYYEMGLVHPDSRTPHPEPPVYENAPFDSFDGIDDDGTVPVPSDAGLGVAYDWDYVEDNALRTRVYE